MDEKTAAEICAGLVASFPQAQVVQGPLGVSRVCWTEEQDSHLCSLVLSDERGWFIAETYAGDYLKDDGAQYLWGRDLGATTIEGVIAELLREPEQAKRTE
ncbi:MAG: hypothetical protein JXA57_20735 [Armatimonadetes bacterium]|nr:hypothetical protein [Armatimonadota bacterium]